MDESEQPTKQEPQPPTPEVAQLLKVLEAQAATRRYQPPATPALLHGASFRYGSLIVIVLFAFGSVAFMEWMLDQVPRPHHRAAAAPPGAVASATPIVARQQ